VTEVTRYPLQWPTGWKRTRADMRQRARFGKDNRNADGSRSGWQRQLTVADALSRLSGELSRLGATNEAVSTNVQVRLDGLPRSGQGEPLDPGAAVYFTLKGKPRCLACDRWTRVADNLAAIAGHIAAIRTVDRYGVGTMEQAFAGYAQLPAAAVDWRSVLGLGATATVEEVEAAFKARARKAHPDVGGDAAEMARLNMARDLARAELGA
jgi:hypothetical protein